MNDDIEYWWIGRFKTYERKSSIIFTLKSNSYSCLPNKKLYKRQYDTPYYIIID